MLFRSQLRYHPNWQVVDRYIDEGITGTSAKKRPAFMKMLSDAKCGKFDLIVVMDDRNYEHVHRLAPSRADAARIFRMREFFSRHPGWDHVPDPYYEGAEGFELVLDMLEDGCEGILAHLGK